MAQEEELSGNMRGIYQGEMIKIVTTEGFQ